MSTPYLSVVGSHVVAFLGRLLACLFALILIVPVILLPRATAVPAYVWPPLGAAVVALLIEFFWVKPTWKGTGLSVTGLALVAGLAVAASQAFASTPPIMGDDGQPLPGSIASLEQVTLNGSRQWVSIRGRDTHKPVLLFLAGGPGGSQLATERYALHELEQHFVVVNWEQPGAGKSFFAVDRSTLTPERYVQDAHALVQYLRQRFDQEKIYVLGESWGSALGIMVVQRYPELFHYMNNNPAIVDNGFSTFRDLAAPEYGLVDKVNWFRGVLDTLGIVYPQLWEVDFRTQATQLDVPVYFLIGRHDVNAPVELVEQYFEVLEAPHKEIIWFEHSGHTPWVSEAERFVQVMAGLAPAHARVP